VNGYFLFYDYLLVSLWYNTNHPLTSISLYSPSYSVFEGICVGMSMDDAIKRIGLPDSESDINRIYYGNSHYIVFTIDRFSQIIKIEWLYFLD
jgi:hypothetical protein